MADQDRLKELVSKRSTWKGVVTRHANTMRRRLDKMDYTDEAEYDEIYGKLLDAKTNFDGLQQEIIKLCGGSSKDLLAQEEVGVQLSDSIRDLIEGYHQGKQYLFSDEEGRKDAPLEPHPLSVSCSSNPHTSSEDGRGESCGPQFSPGTTLRRENEELRRKLTEQEEKSDLLLRSVQELTDQVKALSVKTDSHERGASSPVGGSRRITFNRPDLSRVPLRDGSWGNDADAAPSGTHGWSESRGANPSWTPWNADSCRPDNGWNERESYPRNCDDHYSRSNRSGFPYARTDSRQRRSPYRDGQGPRRGGDYSNGWHPEGDADADVRSRGPAAGQYSSFRRDFGEADSVMSLHKYLLEQSTLQHRSMMSMIHAPQMKLQMFDGNPLDYASFTNAFEDLVDAVMDNPRAKLTTLLAHCEKRAKDAISSCVHKRAEEGYASARKILRNKFGDPVLVSQAWVQKLMEYPNLRNPETLESFATDLVAARDSLESLGHIHELDCTNSIRMIVVKLPFHLRNRWRKVYRLSRNPGEPGPLSQLISLITEAAEDASDPVYNEEALSRVRNTYDTHKGRDARRDQLPARRGAVHFAGDPDLTDFAGHESEEAEALEEYAFHIGQRRSSCAACGATHHYTSRCRTFKDMGPAARLAFVKSKGLCVLCLSADHTTNACKLPWKCQERSCGGRHHTALHGAMATQGASTLATSAESCSTTTEEVTVLATMFDSSCCNPESAADIRGSVNMINHSTFFTNNSPTLPLTLVILRNGDIEVRTYALLDNASTLTLCHSRLMKRLGLREEGRGTISVNTLHTKKDIEGSLVNFEASSAENVQFHPVVEAITIDTLPISMQHIMAGDRLKKWPHLKQLDIPMDRAGSVDLLVGQDNSHLLEPMEKRVGRLFEPYGVLTRLGWTVYGSVSKKAEQGGEVHFAWTSNFPTDAETLQAVCCSQDTSPRSLSDRDVEDPSLTGSSRTSLLDEAGVAHIGPDVVAPELEESLHRFWQGEEVPEVVSRAYENDPAIQRWEREMQVIDGKIHLPIPYKEEPPRFPNNYNAARKALISQGIQLHKKGPKAVKQYVTSMVKNFDHGYAEVVKEDTVTDPDYEFYNLHHGVDHDKKPDTTRIVNNGSGKFKGVSLAMKTWHGPDLMNALIKVLTAFRRFRVGSLADVESMFNQVMVWPLKHRDSLRFVWWEDNIIGGKIIVCRYTTHIFGMCWSPSAAMYALRKTVDLFADHITPKITRSVLDDFYVDDWLNSEQRSQIAIAVLRGVRSTLGHSGMNLTKVASTDRDVIQSVPERIRAKELISLDLVNDALPKGSTLGVGMDLEEDCFIVAVTMKPQPVTRRGLTASVASLYDPIGFLAPFILPAKLLLRETCKAGKRWDEVLEERVEVQWKRWVQDVEVLKGMKIPRWLGCADGLVMVLHTFGDASELSYGAVSYVCSERDDGDIESAVLALAKSKLAPTRTLPIPKLEMNAAVVATKITKAVDLYLGDQIRKWYLWTDSSLALLFVLGNPSDFKPFYANRSSYIQQHTDKESWKHVPGTMNPADCLSRGMKAEELVGNELWRSGPDFLRSPQEQWPKLKSTAEIPKEEMKKHRPVYAVAEVFVPDEGECTFMVSKEGERVAVKVIGLKELVSRSSSLQTTVRAIAWLRRYLMYVQSQMLKKGDLEVEELSEAKRYLVRVNQRFYLSEEQKKSKSFRKLFPQDEMGVLVVGGRLSNCSALSVRARNPYLLPRDSPMARQAVQYHHNRIGHPGVDRTLYETRQEYWILGGRRFISELLRTCLQCRRAKAAPLQQLMGDLPERRVQPYMPPFTYTGVDLFGPFTIVVKRSHDKRYGVLFTCMTCRAIHLEVAVDLSTSAFLNTLERFVARRGRPAVLSSDNGKNFVGGKKSLKEASQMLSDPTIQRKTADEGMQWLMNTPAASHQGGVWERMIRSVRHVLFFLLERHPVTDDKLRTVFCMAENLVNSRPITRVTDDPDALDALSPNHLLTVREPRLIFRKEFSGEQYRRDWREVQQLSTTYWNLWMRDYIPSLQVRTKWYLEKNDIRVGELVLLVQDQYHRSDWPLGVVLEVYPGRDDRIRNVLIKTREGQYRRPISKIVRLEGD